MSSLTKSLGVQTIGDVLAAHPPAHTVASHGAEPPIAFAEFYEEHLAFVWRNAQRLLGAVDESAVEDVTQEVFVVAFRRSAEFEGRSSARTWLFGILRNVVGSHKRARTRRNIRDSVDLEAIQSDAVGPHASLERAQELAL